MFGKYLLQVRDRHPMVHSITNFVTVNDVANAQLACGAGPCMADHPLEAADMTAIAQALNLNMGNPSGQVLEAMVAAGQKANELGHPVVFDPVAVGTTPYRNFVAESIIRQVQLTTIKGNASEMRALMGLGGHTGGVDALDEDKPNEANLLAFTDHLKAFAQAQHCIAAVSGPIDIVTDGHRAFAIRNGHPKMEEVTGTGCMLSGLVAAFLGASLDQPLEATAAAVATLGVAGQIAWANLQPNEGNASYRNRLIDALNLLQADELEACLQCESY